MKSGKLEVEPKEEKDTESKESVIEYATSVAHESGEFIEALRTVIEELNELSSTLKPKPKSPEDVDMKLLNIMGVLLDFIDKKTKEFDEFKAEISERLEKLEESVDAMIKRP